MVTSMYATYVFCYFQSKVSSLVQKHMPKKTMKKKGSWWYWRSSTNQNADSASDEVTVPATSAQMSSAIPVVRATMSSDNEAMSSKVVSGKTAVIVMQKCTSHDSCAEI